MTSAPESVFTRLLHKGSVNVAGLVLSGLVSIVTIPLLLRALGAQGYGLWVVVASSGAILSFLDLGLPMSVTRLVARGGAPSPEIDQTLASVCGAALALGAIGALATAAVVLGAGGAGPLRAPGVALPTVAAAIGIGFLANQLTSLFLAVLRGRERFDLVTALTFGGALVRSVGLVVVAELGRGVLGLSAWSAASASATAAAALVLARCGGVPLRFARPRWRELAPLARFGLETSLTGAGAKVAWELPAVLIGTLAGAAAVARYQVAIKLPYMLSWILVRLGEVLFPLASAAAGRTARSLAVILEDGTRLLLACAWLGCLPLFTFAPAILNVWLGASAPDSVAVFRLTTVAIFVEGAGTAALHVLWGAGRTRIILIATSAMALASMTGVVLGVPAFGIAAAGWSLLLPLVGFKASLVVGAARLTDRRVRSLLASATQGLGPAITVSAAIAWAASAAVRADDLARLVASVLAPTVAFVAVLYGRGARQEERAAIRALFAGRPGTAGTAALTQPTRKVAR